MKIHVEKLTQVYVEDCARRNVPVSYDGIMAKAQAFKEINEAKAEFADAKPFKVDK